jgi:ABC-type multidrug transport system ATPase subunit
LNFEIKIENVQHVKELTFTIDLSKDQIICLTGKNSVGKTTLIRAIRNLSINNTFQDTAAPYIFSENSSVKYQIDDINIHFKYNKKLGVIDTKQKIDDAIRELVIVELPIPHGERFNHFRKLSNIDSDIRSMIALGDYTTPTELIEFLHKVYCNDRFNRLKEVKIKGEYYYFILKDDSDRFYIREDYLSSGEYFVISLFKQIQKRSKVIVIDEIDISLDASAQVNLIDNLREFCSSYNVNIVFTTHSLAVMKKLNADELFYMECNEENGKVEITNRSYNFIKSIMYGFSGHDKYILTEDECLAKYMEHLIKSSPESVFYQYEIIPVAGGTQVIDLMKMNTEKQFLTESQNVISVLDGDQTDERYHAGLSNILFLPFPSIEKEIYQKFLDGDRILPRGVDITGKTFTKKSKSYYKNITKVYNKSCLMPKENIYNYLKTVHTESVEIFQSQLISFLQRSMN